MAWTGAAIAGADADDTARGWRCAAVPVVAVAVAVAAPAALKLANNLLFLILLSVATLLLFRATCECRKKEEIQQNK